MIIPEENVKDLSDIPDNVKNRLEIVPVKWIDRVFEIALERSPEPLPEEEPAQAKPAPAEGPAAVKAAPPAAPGDIVAH